MSTGPVRVLVIDDSPSNRRALVQVLEGAPDVEVIDRACDGEEGLKKAATLRPDVITLDLEMPRLDGFSFLRLLMAHTPTPVVVVSSYAHQSDVFKALELGAVDFVAKPRKLRDDLSTLKEELLEKVRAARQVRPEKRGPTPEGVEDAKGTEEPFIVVVGASTGGPPAIQRLVESVSESRNICLVVAQHMPERFTHAFAERLNRVTLLTVREARDGDVPRPRHVFIAPGGRHLELARGKRGGVQLRTLKPLPGEKHAPSVDRLFESAAAVLVDRALGLVLTGMGTDGAAGALRIHEAGGEVWAEAEESSVIFGMPKAAIDAGAAKRVLPLHALGPALVALSRRRKG